MLRIVFDSNVFISALLFDGPPRQVLELAKDRKLVLVCSKPIIEETARVLREKFSWPDHKVDQLVRQIGRLAELCNPKEELSIVNDDADNRVIECAIAGKAHLIISGDNHLLKLKEYKGIPIQRTKYISYLIKEDIES